GLQDATQPANRLVVPEGLVQVVDQANRMQRIGVVAQVVEIGVDAAMEDAAQIGEGHELGVEKIAAIGSREFAQLVPVFFAGDGFQRRQLKRLAVFNPKS